MKDEEKLAEEYVKSVIDVNAFDWKIVREISLAFLAGLKAGRPKWHKIFGDNPSCYEYWDLPQDNLPEIENLYFVKLTNGAIKICELKYDSWGIKKSFYRLQGGKQSNVSEWLDYPTVQEE